MRVLCIVVFFWVHGWTFAQDFASDDVKRIVGHVKKLTFFKEKIAIDRLESFSKDNNFIYGETKAPAVHANTVVLPSAWQSLPKSRRDQLILHGLLEKIGGSRWFLGVLGPREKLDLNQGISQHLFSDGLAPTQEELDFPAEAFLDPKKAEDMSDEEMDQPFRFDPVKASYGIVRQADEIRASLNRSDFLAKKSRREANYEIALAYLEKTNDVIGTFALQLTNIGHTYQKMQAGPDRQVYGALSMWRLAQLEMLSFYHLRFIINAIGINKFSGEPASVERYIEKVQVKHWLGSENSPLRKKQESLDGTEKVEQYCAMLVQETWDHVFGKIVLSNDDLIALKLELSAHDRMSSGEYRPTNMMDLYEPIKKEVWFYLNYAKVLMNERPDFPAAIRKQIESGISFFELMEK